jgi:hypothetical protein
MAITEPILRLKARNARRAKEVATLGASSSSPILLAKSSLQRDKVGAVLLLGSLTDQS